MVRVSTIASDPVTAWRIRDAMAAHPLLGGAAAQIDVCAGHECVILEGWTLDEGLIEVAGRLAKQVAGKRSVDNRIRANGLGKNRCQGIYRRLQI
ncbi:MAG: BON domain-containing protein [Litorilinea sp.]